MMKHVLIALILISSSLFLFGCVGDSVVACTEEAKICPDGSSVGRVGPDCNFAPCPQIIGGDVDEHGCIPSAGYSWCEEKQKCLRVWEEDCGAIACTMEYAPVCALVQVQCIRAPCNPVEQTFGNKCMADAQDANILYEGECVGDNVQIANPASTNCIDNNGTLEIVDTNEGQVGMCTLSSGNVCEEWAYFRGECN